MAAYSDGDYAAFSVVYQRYVNRVYGYFRKRLQDNEQVNEVFQETFLKLHRSRHRYDPRFPFAPWLFTICRTTLIDFMRKRHGEVKEAPLRGDEADLRGETPEAMGDSLAEKLERHEMSEKDKAMLDLRYKEGLSFEEIAERAGVSKVAARKRLSRIVQGLRKSFAR